MMLVSTKILPWEYVVDLVGEPGNVHGPDSSINGAVLSSVPSPFQISHLKEFQQPYIDNASHCQIPNSKHTCAPSENPLHSGIGQVHRKEDIGLHKNPRETMYSPSDQGCGGNESPERLDVGAAGISREEYSI